MVSVLKEWVEYLAIGMQGTLLTAVRGPDNIRKDHPMKLLIRAFRRAILNGAKPVPNAFMYDSEILTTEELCHNLGETDSSHYPNWWLEKMFQNCVDECPHHWLMHFIHAIEIVGYKHPEEKVRLFWQIVYKAAVESFHMSYETEVQMDKRLNSGPLYY